MVNPYFWPTVTGSGTVTRQLSHELAEQGHEAYVLTVDHDGHAHEERLDGFTVLRIPSRTIRLGGLAFNYALPFTTRRGVQQTVNGILNRIKPDVVHLHGQFWDLCYWAGSAARARGIPVVMTVHTVVVNDNPIYNSIATTGDRYFVRPLASRVTDIWTGYDKRVTDYIRDRYRVDNPVFLPNPVEMGMFTGAGDSRRVRRQIGLADEPIILSLGHVIPLRNRVPLVRALPRILKHVPDARVVVVGEVFDREFLHVAADLGVDDRVIPVGRVPHEDVPDWIAAATVEAHVLHGDAGLGIDVSALEAMSSGVPTVLVVADEVIPGVSLAAYPGLPVLPDGNAKGVGDLIVRLIQDDNARQSAVAAGQSICRDVFSGGVVLERCLDVYRHAVETTQSAAPTNGRARRSGA